MEKTTIGVVLAGGEAQRLGLALKSGLNIAGENLLDRVLSAIKGSCAHVILSVGEHEHNKFYLPDDCTLLSDSGEGPAKALSLVAAHVRANHPQAENLLCVAVDTPFLPHDFAARAHGALTKDVDAVAASFSGQVYPTNALWRMSALAPAKAGGEPQPSGSLFGLLNKCRWVELDYALFQETNPFLNINTPADLVSANRRAQSE